MQWINSLAETLRSSLRGAVRNVQDEFLTQFFIGLKRFERYLIKGVFIALLFMLAVIFLAVASVFFLTDFLGIGRAVAFLAVGILVLLIGVIVTLMR